jgi:uncharacterized protein
MLKPNRTIKASLQPRSLSAGTADEPLLFVEIPFDSMSARVTILPPTSADKKFVSVDDLRNAMGKYNIVHGIDQNLLMEISAKITQYAADKNLDDMIEVDLAHGTRPQPGQDAKVEYFYEKEQSSHHVELTEDEEGRVDYKTGKKITNVSKGDLLLRKTPVVPGKPGKTINGREVPPPPPKDIVLSYGKGVLPGVDNPDEFYADEDGHVMMKDGRVTVQPVYEVRGDVDMTVGNIDFFGTVIVHGDVKDGFKINAGGDLMVRGVVEGADLQVEGNLTVSGGVTGNDKAHIRCKGNALIKYIQNATVEVTGNLGVKQFILHSKVTCDHTITVAGAKGMIVGGPVIARRELTAGAIGNKLATPTEIIVGEQVDLRVEILNADEEIRDITNKIEKIRKSLVHFKDVNARSGKQLSDEKKELQTWMARALVKLTHDAKVVSQKKNELEVKQAVFLKEKPVPRVNCTYKIYPGVKVMINRAYIAFQDEQKYCSLIEMEGEVRFTTLKTKTKAQTV